jgi:hypothetical protein
MPDPTFAVVCPPWKPPHAPCGEGRGRLSGGWSEVAAVAAGRQSRSAARGQAAQPRHTSSDAACALPSHHRPGRPHRSGQEAQRAPRIDHHCSKPQAVDRRLHRGAMRRFGGRVHQQGAGEGAPEVVVGGGHRRLKVALLQAGRARCGRHLQGGQEGRGGERKDEAGRAGEGAPAAPLRPALCATAHSLPCCLNLPRPRSPAQT